MDTTATPKSSGSIPNSLLEGALIPLNAAIAELESIRGLKDSKINALWEDLKRYSLKVSELNLKIEQGNYNFTLPERLKWYEDGYYERGDEIENLYHRIRRLEQDNIVIDAQNRNLNAMLNNAETELDLATAEADRLDDELTLATAEATSLSENLDEIIEAAGGLAIAHVRLLTQCKGEGIFGITAH